MESPVVSRVRRQNPCALALEHSADPAHNGCPGRMPRSHELVVVCAPDLQEIRRGERARSSGSISSGGFPAFVELPREVRRDVDVAAPGHEDSGDSQEGVDAAADGGAPVGCLGLLGCLGKAAEVPFNSVLFVGELRFMRREHVGGRSDRNAETRDHGGGTTSSGSGPAGDCQSQLPASRVPKDHDPRDVDGLRGCDDSSEVLQSLEAVVLGAREPSALRVSATVLDQGDCKAAAKEVRDQRRALGVVGVPFVLPEAAVDEEDHGEAGAAAGVRDREVPLFWKVDVDSLGLVGISVPMTRQRQRRQVIIRKGYKWRALW